MPSLSRTWRIPPVVGMITCVYIYSETIRLEEEKRKLFRCQASGPDRRSAAHLPTTRTVLPPTENGLPLAMMISKLENESSRSSSVPWKMTHLATAFRASRAILQLVGNNAGPQRVVLLNELCEALRASNRDHVGATKSRIPKEYKALPGEMERVHAVLQQGAANSAKEFESTGNMNENHKPRLSDANATYGTTPPETVLTLLDTILTGDKDKTKQTYGLFIDAGSGMGVPTLVAALSKHFTRSRGIEYVAMHHEQALYLKEAYDNLTLQDRRCVLDYTCGDLSEQWKEHFSGAGVVFCNSVTWDATLCAAVATGLERAGSNCEEDMLVVSLSGKFALPSFDLVDVLTLQANGGGMFTFYVSRRRGIAASSERRSRYPHALSDSKAIRGLDESKSSESKASNSLLDRLIEVCVSGESTAEQHAGLAFLAVVCESETGARMVCRNAQVLDYIIHESGSSSSLVRRASASLVLRALVEFPIGGHVVGCSETLMNGLIAWLADQEEHPAIQANLLDVVGKLLEVSPLETSLKRLDEQLGTIGSHEDVSDDAMEAIGHISEMKQWWTGQARNLPGNAKF